MLPSGFIYIVPDLVLICSIYFSLLNGKLVGETTGFISGILLDFITGIPFGFNCLFRTIIGYVYGFFAKNVIISGFILPMLCVGIGTIAKTLMVELLGLLFPNVHIYIAGIISHDFLFEFIENVLLSPFIFKFLSFFRKSLAITTTFPCRRLCATSTSKPATTTSVFYIMSWRTSV